MKLTETTIRNLIAKGASRWTKGDHDRLYLNGAAKEIVGLETTHYKSGSISSATLKGESISNNRAGKISDIICSAYIDLTTGKLYGRVRGDSMDLLRAALEDLIENEKAQDSTETTTTTTVQDSTEEIKEDTMKKSIKETMKEEALIKDEFTCYPVGDLYLTTGDMHAILHVYHEVNRLYAKFDALIEKREKDPDPRMVAYHEELQVLREEQAELRGMAIGISMSMSNSGPYSYSEVGHTPIVDLCHSRNRDHKPELIEQINDFLFEA
jgi:hypothetical protein